MKNLSKNEMILIEGGRSCFTNGLMAPFALVFSGFIPSSTLDSYWKETIDGCNL